MQNLLNLIPKVNSNLYAINVKEKLQDTTVASYYPLHSVWLAERKELLNGRILTSIMA